MAKKKSKEWTLTEPEPEPAPAPVVTAPPVVAQPEPEELVLTPPEPEPRASVMRQRENFSSYVRPGIGLELRELAVRLTRQSGIRVSIADLATEAFEDLLKKYGQR